MRIIERSQQSHNSNSSIVDPDVFSTAFSTSALEARFGNITSKPSPVKRLSEQSGTDHLWELDTDPVIQWPEKLKDQTTIAFEFGGKGWGDLKTADGDEKHSDELSDWCLSHYREALYMPEMIYSLSSIIPTLQHLVPAVASKTSTESCRNVSSPLSALVRTIPDLSQKYKRILPPLLPSLVNPSSKIPHGESGLGMKEWSALKSGFGLFLGSQGEKEKESRRRKEKEKDVEEGEKEMDHKEEEEEEERRRIEREKEERWIEKGKKWLERLERRETLLQILVHLLLLPLPSSPPPPICNQTEPHNDQSGSRSKPKKRSRSDPKSSRLSSKKVDPISKSLDQLTDRLSVWQALDSLGVEEAGTGEAEKDRQQDVRKVKEDPQMKGREVKEERDWIRIFWEDVVEKYFSQTHNYIIPLLRSKLSFPPLAKTDLSRPKFLPQPATTSMDCIIPSSRSNKSSSVALASSSSAELILTGDGSTLVTGKSRTKPLARQLPSSANASVRLDLARSKFPLRSSASISLSSSTNSSQHLTQDSLPRRTHSSSHNTLGLTRSASNISLSSSLSSTSASFGPRAGFVRSGSTSSTTGAMNSSVSRANSVGPETKAEKLMRRSVSFSRGVSVGRKGSSDAEMGTGIGSGDKVEVNGKKKMERTNSVGGRTLMASTSFSSSTSTLPSRSGPSLNASFNQGNSQSQSQPQTLVPATPTKPVASASHSAHSLTQPSSQPTFAPDSPEFMGETPPRHVRSSGLIPEFQHGQARFGGKGLFGGIVVGVPDEEEDEGGGGMMDLFVIGTDDEGDI
ncbi:DNA replication regulator Sld3 [Phaffia rhodozyma]|uniref:DNA replication regulator Sld3 n=1 Tax=Phaffia rhodozyma TaxID=264483 RepID=A0A0F7SGS7_PHARH|nr:DNA replication regulator Sld3 [Phaffia rhodozyma]